MALSKRRIEDMAHNIANTIEHGECFYEQDDLIRLLFAVQDLGKACQEYYAQCQEEDAE